HHDEESHDDVLHHVPGLDHDNCGAMQADLPLEDMIYAAAHAYLDSRGTGWITAIFDAAGGSS
uniref:hypothetical protein n=1 Tax=Mycolicibacterium obuense TaxID=1807 RepID=UPI0023F75F7B